VDDTINIDPTIIAVILAVVVVAIIIGFTVRRITRFDYPQDFISLFVFAVLFVVSYIMNKFSYSIALPVFFAVAYLLGFWMGSYVAHHENIELLQIAVDDDQIVHFRRIEGEYYYDIKAGLCRVPDTNYELFNQIVNGVYHKVEYNAPPDTIAFMKEDKEHKRPFWDGIIKDNVVDDETERKIILVEDIDVKERTEKGRFLTKTTTRTVITIAYGSMIPRATLLSEIKTLDNINSKISEVEAKLLKLKTEEVSMLAHIAATELIKVAEDNPAIEIIHQFNLNEDDKRQEEAAKKEEKAAKARKARADRKAADKAAKEEDENESGA